MNEYQKDVMELSELKNNYRDLMFSARRRAKYLLEFCTKLEECSAKYNVTREHLMREFMTI